MSLEKKKKQQNLHHRMHDGYHISKVHTSVLLFISLDFGWEKTDYHPTRRLSQKQKKSE